MEQNEIQELVQRSLRHDTVAFTGLVSEFQPLVFRLAFRLLCDEDEARDMVQDTFLKVWLSLNKYNGKSRFSTWIYKITCNTCYDRLRSLRHSSVESGARFFGQVDLLSDDNPESDLSNKQLKELILKYTSELAPQQKLIFMLRDVEELDVTEVREITGLSADKIKHTLFQARKNIRNKMNQIATEL